MRAGRRAGERAWESSGEDSVWGFYSCPMAIGRRLPKTLSRTAGEGLKIGVGAAAGLQRRPGPPRPDAGDRLVRIAVMSPADSGVGRHVDRLGALLEHDQFLGLDIAVLAAVAIGPLVD